MGQGHSQCVPVPARRDGGGRGRVRDLRTDLASRQVPYRQPQFGLPATVTFGNTSAWAPNIDRIELGRVVG
ncbi:hypothetical protein EJ357_03285 [Streptomyces cyaneochromogenes]|uniref:Uncharacterized protein n=1 Tax=Streptomyces cyaneochromogenes TaxID=2496836 RepID=A0A3Q9ENS8_9ACTN|nr:hypothetical protein [Streptomyces cyaneochromogenes]AZQ32584.1 hypothetical protein EJ357_03285 [Streptomyces cyaneochromogenes]